MEVTAVEDELRRVKSTTCVKFGTYIHLTCKQCKKLESHNYLYLDVGEAIIEEKLSHFLTKLLSRRGQTNLEAVYIRFPYILVPESNEKLITCFQSVLSSTSLVYLE